VSKTPAIESSAAVEAAPAEAESAEAETAQDVNLDATLPEIDIMLLDAAAKEAAAAAEEIPGTLARKGKEKPRIFRKKRTSTSKIYLGKNCRRLKKKD
jgi:hypothetical protein